MPTSRRRISSSEISAGSGAWAGELWEAAGGAGAGSAGAAEGADWVSVGAGVGADVAGWDSSGDGVFAAGWASGAGAGAGGEDWSLEGGWAAGACAAGWVSGAGAGAGGEDWLGVCCWAAGWSPAARACCALTPVRADDTRTTAIAATKTSRLSRAEDFANEKERRREIICGMGEPLMVTLASFRSSRARKQSPGRVTCELRLAVRELPDLIPV